MTDDQTQALLTARLLATLPYTAAANALLFALSEQAGGLGFALHLPLAAALACCHIRLDFDRRIFADFALGRCTPAAFDQALAQSGLRRKIPPARPMARRSAGALSLWRKYLYLTAAQMLLLAAHAV